MWQAFRDLGPDSAKWFMVPDAIVAGSGLAGHGIGVPAPVRAVQDVPNVCDWGEHERIVEMADFVERQGNQPCRGGAGSRTLASPATLLATTDRSPSSGSSNGLDPSNTACGRAPSGS